MKSLQLKISGVLFVLLALAALSGPLSFLFFPSPFKYVIPASVLILSGGLSFILIRLTVLNRLYEMKREIDNMEEDGVSDPFALRGTDEFDELAKRLNSMIADFRDKQSAGRDQLIREISASENDKYLLNINEGLLFVDYGQIISQYHSTALADIFDREEIGGQHISDFLYPDKEEDRDKRKILEKFIIGLFNNPDSIERIDPESNPLHNIWISRDDGRRVLVDGTVRKVEEKGELVQLMIIFRDRTDEGLLEKKIDEKEMRSDFELETVIAILRAGSGPFLQFIEESGDILVRFRDNIRNMEDGAVVQCSFRDISSMKCSAVYFDFKAVEKLCHNLEDILSEFRDGNFSRKEALDIIVDDIYGQFDHVRQLISRFQEFLSSQEGRVYETNRNEQEHFFDTLKIMMARHADELEKDVRFSFSSDYENYSGIEDIKNPVIHLLRNAVDHGIELPDDREAGGKERLGRIHLHIAAAEEGQTKITVEDDGSGIDFDRLRKIAVEKGFIKKEESPGQANLLRTLFKSGFSFRDEMDGLSGRGVGLDAVKEEISRLGGKISVKTDRLKGSRFTIVLPPG